MAQTRKTRSNNLDDVTTFSRLTLAASAFVPLDGRQRRVVPNGRGDAYVETVELGPWEEGSHGDPMHKLVMVLSGQIDVEGTSGGWLVLRNHMIFIPMGRPFNLRAAEGTTLLVAHMGPADCPWPRPGCWVNGAEDIARVMLRYPLRWSSQPARDAEAASLFLKTLATVCLDWFENPRMLHIPSAKSEPMRRMLTYLRDHLADANLVDACSKADLTPRTLQRHCEEETGLGWRELLREVRTMRAMELLVTGNMAVGDVAKAVGFQSISAFATSFTARLGVSPSAFSRAFSPTQAQA
jgi:AraC-like DNA-binding protein